MPVSNAFEKGVFGEGIYLFVYKYLLIHKRGWQMRTWTLTICVGIALACMQFPAEAQSISSSSVGTDNHSHSAASAFPVTVDVVVDEIRNISIGNANFEIVAETLLTWTLPQLANQATVERTITGTAVDETLANTWDPGIYIRNALQPRTIVARSLTIYPDGHIELYEKFSAVLSIDASMPTYPFGEIDLHLELQSVNHPLPELLLAPRKFELGHHGNSDEVAKGNWSLHDRRTEVTETSSLSHGGTSRFSVAVLHLALAHDFFDIAQKILAPLLSVMFLSLLINRYIVIYETESGGDNGNWRVGGQLTLLLTLFALKFSLGDEIPATHYLTMIDALFIAVGLIVVLALVWGIYVIYSFQSGRIEFAQKLEHKSNIIFLLLAACLLSWVFTYALK